MIVMETTPRKKLSKQEAYRLIEDYFSSGELPSVFYSRVGLSEGQFYKWRRRYLSDHPQFAKRLGIVIGKDVSIARGNNRKSITKVPSTTSGFGRIIDVSDSTPITASAVTASSNSIFAYELCYPNGVVLRLPVGTTALSLTELIRLY